MYTCTVHTAQFNIFWKKLSNSTQLQSTYLSFIFIIKSNTWPTVIFESSTWNASSIDSIFQRKRCVSNFEDKCEYGHELPNVGMKSVNVIILKRFWLPLAEAVAVASGRRLSISKGFWPSDWPWRFSATATSPSIFACILYLVSTLFIFERRNNEVKRGHQDIKTTTNSYEPHDKHALNFLKDHPKRSECVDVPSTAFPTQYNIRKPDTLSRTVIVVLNNFYAYSEEFLTDSPSCSHMPFSMALWASRTIGLQIGLRGCRLPASPLQRVLCYHLASPRRSYPSYGFPL